VYQCALRITNLKLALLNIFSLLIVFVRLTEHFILIECVCVYTVYTALQLVERGGHSEKWQQRELTEALQTEL
jgi:hypothetical protein